MKTALIVRHTPYEGIAGFRAPLEAAGYALDTVDVTDAGFADLDLSAPDLLVLLGGPMAVHEADAHPWMTGEIARVAQRLERDLPTLGICLGSQIMASAMGAPVYIAFAKEVGFAAVTMNAAGSTSPLLFLAGIPMLHWHGDTFDLPHGAELLASTPNCPHQAFRRGRNILALQFHPEMGDDPSFEEWLDGSEDYAADAGTSIADLRRDHALLGDAAATAGRAMLARWIDEL